jgi:hypothetical protein
MFEMNRACEVVHLAWSGTKPTLMWLAWMPVTWAGIEAWVHGATTLIGFLTALCGLVMGLLGTVWWIRRVRKQSEDLE